MKLNTIRWNNNYHYVHILWLAQFRIPSNLFEGDIDNCADIS